LDVEEIVEKLDDLRDADRDEEADGLLADVAQGHDPVVVARLHGALEDAGRRVDVAKLLEEAALNCPGPHLRCLALAVDGPGDRDGTGIRASGQRPGSCLLKCLRGRRAARKGLWAVRQPEAPLRRA
jgi:hypothetical protein